MKEWVNERMKKKKKKKIVYCKKDIIFFKTLIHIFINPQRQVLYL
uniref:Uncharacterized protein n=1 Tax=viral metagenome TaxID=1070528 RepID=A0A6C0D281_9ZZZZ